MNVKTLAAALLAVLVTILVHNQVDMVVGSISKLFILAAPCTIAIELDRLDRRERLERFERP